MKKLVSILLVGIIACACSEGEKSEVQNAPAFDSEFLKKADEIKISIAGVQTHVEETSTDIVDNNPQAILKLNCNVSCYEDNLKELDLILSSAQQTTCYPTFFIQKISVFSKENASDFYLDLNGHQMKIGNKCYHLEKRHEFKVSDLGFLEWEKGSD